MMAEMDNCTLDRSVKVIGIVCVQVSRGGAERATFIWARRRAAEGCRIVWFCEARWAEDVRRAFAEAGVDWKLCPIDSKDRAARVEVLRRQIVEQRIDTMLLADHWQKIIFSDLATAKAAGCRVIVAEHNAFHFPLELADYEMMQLRLTEYPKADVVTVLSPENVAWWKAAGVTNVVYMPNYLTFEPPEEYVPREMPSENEFLYVGRVCERKGAEKALEAVRIARTRYGLSDAHLTFVGYFDSPEFEAEMRNRVKATGMEDAVTFVGQVSDVATYFRRAKVFLMPSRIEGAPMVLMEAKSHALPAVIFEMPYVDGTHPGQGVVSAPYGDVEALAKGIVDVATDVSLWQRLSKEAFCSLVDFRAERIDRRWESVFDALENGLPIVAGCPEVPADCMFAMTMQALVASLGPMVDEQRAGWNVYLDLDRVLQSAECRWGQFLRKIAGRSDRMKLSGRIPVKVDQ